MRVSRLVHKIKSLFVKKRIEYVYVFQLPHLKFHEEERKKRQDVLLDIKKDMRMKIYHTDFLTNYSKGSTLFTIATETPKDSSIVPLMYEIYAFFKTGDETKFSFKFEKLNLHDTEVLKFKVKCLGKKKIK